MKKETKDIINFTAVVAFFIGLGLTIITILFILHNMIYPGNICCEDEHNDTIIIRANNKCFFNGYEIDCENNLPYKTITTDGNFDCEPIFKYNKKWKDILSEE